jgi:16S rRNA (guanine527-N7)-methyltransferase
MNPEIIQQFVATAADFGVILNAEQREHFLRYARELEDWNQRVNLTSIRGLDAIVTRHFLDSLSCASAWPVAAAGLIDVGSGAGFPGLALKIWQPDLHLTMVESVGKKADFLEHITEMLGLTDVVVLRERVEAVGHMLQHRERYDVATVRAVAELRVLAEYCLPLLRVGGRLIALKGHNLQAELDAAAGAIATLGGMPPQMSDVHIAGLEPRSLVCIDKQAATPDRFPRAVGVPARRPLG